MRAFITHAAMCDRLSVLTDERVADLEREAHILRGTHERSHTLVSVQLCCQVPKFFHQNHRPF
jgi:hypothetical protein